MERLRSLTVIVNPDKLEPFVQFSDLSAEQRAKLLQSKGPNHRIRRCRTKVCEIMSGVRPDREGRPRGSPRKLPRQRGHFQSRVSSKVTFTPLVDQSELDALNERALHS